MNKKGQIDMEIVFYLGILLFIIVGSLLALDYISKTGTKAKNEACQELGYDEFKSGYGSRGFDFCKDDKGNLHYVETTFPKGWSSFYVEVREISIGNVRVQ